MICHLAFSRIPHNKDFIARRHPSNLSRIGKSSLLSAPANPVIDGGHMPGRPTRRGHEGSSPPPVPRAPSLPANHTTSQSVSLADGRAGRRVVVTEFMCRRVFWQLSRTSPRRPCRLTTSIDGSAAVAAPEADAPLALAPATTPAAPSSSSAADHCLSD